MAKIVSRQRARKRKVVVQLSQTEVTTARNLGLPIDDQGCIDCGSSAAKAKKLHRRINGNKIKEKETKRR